MTDVIYPPSIINFEYFKAYSPIPQNYNLEEIRPFFSVAEEIWLVPLLGKALYDEILEQGEVLGYGFEVLFRKDEFAHTVDVALTEVAINECRQVGANKFGGKICEHIKGIVHTNLFHNRVAFVGVQRLLVST